MSNQRNSLRRSKSATSLIPLPRLTVSRASEERTSIYDQARGRPLVASETKLKRSHSGSNLRCSSVDNKARTSATQRLSRLPTTPLSSTQKTPLRHSSTTKKDLRPVNEKKWQNEQFAKVKAFLSDYPEIVNNLKPPTIQTFVDTMNILFGYIDDRINMNLMNYREQVPTYMKHLGYPAAITTSMLKCVNTSHSWPQVLALFSWLIDFIHNVCYSPVTVESNENGNDLCQSIGSYLLESYMAWNRGEDECEVDNTFQKAMFELFEFNEEEYLEMQYNSESLQKQFLKHEAVEKELLENITAVQNELEIKKNEINEFRNTPSKTQEDRCQDYKQQIANLEKALIAKRLEINKLNEAVSMQLCTYNEFKTRKEKVEALKDELQLQKEKIQKWIEIIGNCDYELANAKKKLDRAVLEQNLAVMHWEQLNPKMKNLELKITGYAQVKDEIKRVSNLRTNYYKEFDEEVNSLKPKYSDSLNTHKTLIQNYERKQDELQKVRETKELVERELDTYEFESEAEIKSLSKLLYKETEEHKRLLSEILVIVSEVNSLKEQLQLTKKKVTDESAALQEMQEQMLDFFKKLENNIQNNLKRIEEMEEHVITKTKAAVKNKIKEREQMIEHLRMYLNDMKI